MKSPSGSFFKSKKGKPWYQSWWGMLLISVWGGTLVAIIQITIGVLITIR